MIFDMLTADAASKHGHEFSDPQPARWLVPRKSPFKVFPYATRNKLPNRSRTGRGTMGELKEEPEEPEDPDDSLRPQISIGQLRIPGSFDDHPPSPPLLPPTTEEISSTSTTDCPPTPIPHSPVEALLPTPEKRCHRSKIRYAFAHPPPTGVQLRKKGIIRPRTLFQLQIQTLSGFHRPAYEVLPLNLLENNNTIMKGLKRIGKGKLSLGAKDLVIIKTDHYKTSEENIRDLASRDVVGILSASNAAEGESRRSAQLVFDGAAWIISQTRKDVYDLSNTADDSQCARWYVPKSHKRNSSNSQIGTMDPKFYFAAILPHTKRHPTVASMSKAFLDIYDSFTVHMRNYATDDHQSDRSHQMLDTSSSTSSQVLPQPLETPVVTDTDDVLRRLIVASAVWITFCEGWSPLMTVDVESKSTAIPNVATPKRTPSLSISPNVTTPITPAYSTLRSKNLLTTLRRSKTIDTPSAKILPEESNLILETESQTPTHHKSSPSNDIQQATSKNPASLTLNDKPPVISIKPPVPSQGGANSSSVQDPTAQFRHLMAMDLSYPPTSSSPVPRFDSVARRRSTHASPSISRESSRSRPVSWTRHLSIHPNTHIHDLKVSSQPTSRASSDHGGQPDDTTRDNYSENNETPYSARSLTPSFSPSPQSWQSPPNRDSIASQPDTQASTADRQPEPEVAAVTSHQEYAKTTSVQSQLGEERQQPESFAEAVPSRPSSSDESEGSLHGGIGGPYWRDFDLIQTRAFVQRFEQVQRQVHHHQENKDEKAQAEVMETLPPQTESSGGSTDNGEGNGGGRWFSGIRRTVSRRRKSMIN